MSLWSKLFHRGTGTAGQVEVAPPAAPAEDAGNPVELPVEPFVFECQSCGKVFEARRKRPQCPECDSPDVLLLSE